VENNQKHSLKAKGEVFQVLGIIGLLFFLHQIKQMCVQMNIFWDHRNQQKECFVVN
jgi:hypothetical protein